MVRPDIQEGKCPINKAGCRGVRILHGEEAKAFLGPFFRPCATAIACAYSGNPTHNADIRDCESAMEGGVMTLEDAPVE